jgi:hypothetical protein
MSWKIENIYKSTGAELTTGSLITSLAGAANICHDGRYLWVTASNGIYIYEYWGASSDDEPTWDTLTKLHYPRYDSGRKQKPRLVTVISITSSQFIRVTREPSLADAGATVTAIADESAYSKTTARTGSSFTPYWIAKLGNKMYVTNGAAFSQIIEFDIASQQPTSLPVINIPETFNGSPRSMNSNLIASGGQLWFVGNYDTAEVQDPTKQKLYSYVPATSTKATYDIAARPSLARTWLADGFNGFVYLTLSNDVGVLKVNNVTGAMSIIRVNSTPTRMFSGQDRRIWVNSFAGMLSLVDYDDDGVHNDWSTETAGALSFQTQPGAANLMWFINADGKLVRHDLNTKQQFETGATKDWEFSHDLLTTPEVMLITEAGAYENSVGAVEIKPYIWMLQDGVLIGFRLFNYLYREAFASLNGQAAVASGVEQYFGE